MQDQRKTFLIPQSSLEGDDAHLREIARKMHDGTIGMLQPFDESVLSTTGGTDSEFQRWIAGLSASPAGQKLLDHLAHVDAAPHIKTSSAVEQVMTFRRVFMHALKNNPTPFGIPKKTPKFIAIVNFSGEQLLLYSSNSSLVSLLSVGATSSASSVEGVQQIIAKASMQPNCSVLMCYSLPFQMGIDAAYWDCRILTRTGNTFDDGDLACTIWNGSASRTASTVSSESQRQDVLDAQVDSFQSSIKACDIDMAFEKIEGVDPSDSTDERSSKLMTMIAMLQSERRKMISDHKQEIEDLKEAHTKDIMKSNDFMKAHYEKQHDSDTKTDEEMTELKVENMGLREALLIKDRECQSYKSDSLIKEEAHEKEKCTLSTKLNEALKEVQSLKAQCKRMESDHTDTMKKQQLIHRQLQEESERKLQMAKRSEMAATNSIDKIKALEHTVDAISNEKTFLSSQLVESKRACIACKFRLLVKLVIIQDNHKSAKRMRMEYAKCMAEADATIKMHTEANENMKLTIDQERRAVEQHALKVEELTSQVNCLKEEAEQKQDVKDVADAHIQTDILQETLKMGELETENVKLNDEIANLKLELSRARSRNNKKAPPPSLLPEEPPASISKQLDATTAHDPTQPRSKSTTITQADTLTESVIHKDSVLENTIQQLHMSLNTVLDLARKSKSHEQHYRDTWNKLTAYEGMNMHAHQAGGAYAMQSFMYMPVHPQQGNGMGHY